MVACFFKFLEVFGKAGIGLVAEEDATGFAKSGGFLDNAWAFEEGDLRAAAQEVFELDDEFVSCGVMKLASEVLRAFDEDFSHLGILADLFEQIEGAGAITTPEAAAQEFGGLGGSHLIKAHEFGLVEEFFAHPGGFAVPFESCEGEGDIEALDGVCDLVADIDAIGEFAAEDADVFALWVDLDGVFA